MGALVQATGSFATAAVATRAQAFGSNVTAGNLIVVVAQWASSTATLSSVTDTQSNAYTIIAGSLGTRATGSNFRTQIAYAVIGSSAACTVTMTTSVSTSILREIYIHEFSGLSTTGQPDASGNNNGASTNPSGSVAVVAQPGVIVAGAIDSAGTLTPGAGFTVGFAQNGDTSQYKTYSATGATTVPFVDASSGNWAMSIASFRDAGTTVYPQRNQLLPAAAVQRAATR